VTSYTYDAANNRSTKTVNGTATVYTYGQKGVSGFNSNQLISYGLQGQSAGQTYTYDACGNRKTSVKVGQTDTYTWDFENRLTGLSYHTGATSASGSYSYAYDYRGRRVVRDESYISGRIKSGISFSGATSALEFEVHEIHDREEDAESDTQENILEYVFGLDPLNGFLSASYTPPYPTSSYNEWASAAILQRLTSAEIIAYRNARTSLKSELIRGSDWGGGVGGVLYSVRGGQRSFIGGYNSRGDVASTSDDLGGALWQASYEAFGTRTGEDGSNLERQRANTKDEDPTGLLNEGMRLRDLATGLFISRDPAGLVAGPNDYSYVRQNPWSKFDPLGLDEKKIGEVYLVVNHQTKEFYVGETEKTGQGRVNETGHPATKIRNTDGTYVITKPIYGDDGIDGVNAKSQRMKVEWDVYEEQKKTLVGYTALNDEKPMISDKMYEAVEKSGAVRVGDEAPTIMKSSRDILSLSGRRSVSPVKQSAGGAVLEFMKSPKGAGVVAIASVALMFTSGNDAGKETAKALADWKTSVERQNDIAATSASAVLAQHLSQEIAGPLYSKIFAQIAHSGDEAMKKDN
jgi:RHS repeat-associated protein